uniref:Ig-like and fibronectin type-III domain-containing protein C25G4.10 n=1 Tax=Syphacia muris TaxID=451379 RepID=A0A0N5APE3_9BILA
MWTSWFVLNFLCCCCCQFCCQLAAATAATVAVEQCCHRHGVSDDCAKTLCNPKNIPDDFAVYNIFDRHMNCFPFMAAISECLADRRNHMHCCVRDAKDRDEDACFTMCRGEAPGRDLPWDKFQTCFAINVEPMYKCFLEGYQTIPSAPQSLRILLKTNNSVSLAWNAPQTNAHLIGSYHVTLTDADDTGNVRTENTRDSKITIGNLESDSKYIVSVVAVTRDGLRRSLSAEKLHFFTFGAAPQITAYRETVSVPRQGSSVTLACRMIITGTVHRPTRTQWLKFNEHTKRFEQITEYLSSSYISFADSPRYFVMTLKISPIQESTAGQYRCYVSNDLGSAQAEISVSIRNKVVPKPTPPESPASCCKRQGIRALCAAFCGNDRSKKTALKTEVFIKHHCEDETEKFLACSASDSDEGACCLRNKIPSNCLFLCDGSKVINKNIPHLCAPYSIIIFQCRMEEAEDRPEVVTGLKVNSDRPESDKFSVAWNKAAKADVYHVYYRKNSNDWILQTTQDVQVQLEGPVEEIVVVSSNSVGNAHAARISKQNGRWKASYY